jgi:hypothetical protein
MLWPPKILGAETATAAPALIGQVHVGNDPSVPDGLVGGKVRDEPSVGQRVRETVKNEDALVRPGDRENITRRRGAMGRIATEAVNMNRKRGEGACVEVPRSGS